MLSGRFGRWTLTFGLLLVMTPLAHAGRSGKCKALMKRVQSMAKHERKARSSLTRPGAQARHQARAEALKAKVQASLDSCDWSTRLGPHKMLRPYHHAFQKHRTGPVHDALVQSFLGLDAGIRAMLPDDRLCMLAVRTSGGRRGMHACYRGQERGATEANLSRLAKGLCAVRKRGDNKNFSLDMNVTAKLVEVPGLPPGFPAQLMDHWLSEHCPDLR